MNELNHIKSFGELKNASHKRVKCIPDTHKSEYLELYILNREKTRLKQEIFSLEKRRSNAKGQLENIVKNMNQIRYKTKEQDGELTNKNFSSKPIKLMSISY